MINVTRTYLPDKEKYKKYLDEIYDNGWVTNEGPLVKRLEKRLAGYLGVRNIVLVANGTAALEIAYRTLGIKGSVVTTPFSFVATTSSAVTNGLHPIFADISSRTFNLDPQNIVKTVAPDTSAIIPVHVFGNACEVEEIKYVAREKGLRVIYDAAHAFGVNYKGKSILNFGDISTLSFHATKLFHTIEGGALVINDDELVKKARYLINFGIKSREEIPELGTNAKMNEFEAAMGLCILDDMEDILEERKALFEKYCSELNGLVKFQEQNCDSTMNYSYFPVLFQNEEELKIVEEALNKKDIFPRRYFFPSLDMLNYIKPPQIMPVSRNVARRVMCLPLYNGLEDEIQSNIIKIIKNNLG